MLQIEHFTKEYGNKIAVNDLSLEIRSGEIFGFIGHNGAGKTTTIKAVAGILPFQKGEIRVDGISVRENPLECKKRMAYIPDNPDLYEFLSGIQYLNFIADIFQVPKREREERIGKYGDLFGLTGDLGSTVSTYSHGMKQKLALISAFVHAPRLLVLDEPFVGLDPQAAFRLKEMMHELCEQGGAIFFSTHVLEVAEKLCNRIAIIRRGRLVACGPTEEIRGDSSLEEVFLEVVEHEK